MPSEAPRRRSLVAIIAGAVAIGSLGLLGGEKTAAQPSASGP